MKLFRVFCWRMYLDNKDEYAEWGETVPHTFEEYVRKNLNLLKNIIGRYAMRASEFITASLGILTIGAVLGWAFAAAAKMPDVHFSYSTDECVRVVNYTDTKYSCENLPDRFYHVWVK